MEESEFQHLGRLCLQKQMYSGMVKDKIMNVCTGVFASLNTSGVLLV